jgi:hypothetical protein
LWAQAPLFSRFSATISRLTWQPNDVRWWIMGVRRSGDLRAQSASFRVIDTSDGLQVGYREMFRRRHHVHHHHPHFGRGQVPAELHVI